MGKTVGDMANGTFVYQKNNELMRIDTSQPPRDKTVFLPLSQEQINACVRIVPLDVDVELRLMAVEQQLLVLGKQIEDLTAMLHIEKSIDIT